ncbi:MAG: simple sugar transport system permease protein, partial [Anaerolineales bacterium]|nr:simple sugar transport system permease protein [Anaerolineales bacterium]
MRPGVAASSAALRLGAVLLALLFTTGVLLVAGAPPLEAYRQIVIGSLGSVKKITDVLVAWVPLVTLDSGLPPALAIGAAILAGILGGAMWALLAGLLKAYGGVNEIFGGLGLNFVAVALNVWLIFGPWGRPGVASMSGTEPFPDFFSLPALSGL